MDRHCLELFSLLLFSPSMTKSSSAIHCPILPTHSSESLSKSLTVCSVQMRESNGKTPPRGDVMRFLKQKGYKDSKNCAGQGDSVVVLPRGQGIEGTCKSGTRIDYILASASLPYRFVGGSYAMVSSKGTSHHHLVKVDIQPT